MNEADYHRDASLSHSKIEDFIRSPSVYYGRHVAQPRTIAAWDGTDETMLGSATHALVLEGQDVFERKFAIWKGGPTEKGEHSMRAGTNAHKSFLVECQANRQQVITTKQLDAAQAMATALHDHHEARELLFNWRGEPEVTLTWETDLDGRCKARLDRLCRDYRAIIDLKTFSADNFPALEKQAAGLGYHRKVDWYSRGYFQSFGETPDHFFFVGVRSVAPHDVFIWELTPDAEAIAKIEIDIALEGIRACKASGDWSPMESRAVQRVDVPLWAMSAAARKVWQEQGR